MSDDFDFDQLARLAFHDRQGWHRAPLSISRWRIRKELIERGVLPRFRRGVGAVLVQLQATSEDDMPRPAPEELPFPIIPTG